jgi:hypothetical protein
MCILWVASLAAAAAAAAAAASSFKQLQPHCLSLPGGAAGWQYMPSAVVQVWCGQPKQLEGQSTAAISHTRVTKQNARTGIASQHTSTDRAACKVDVPALMQQVTPEVIAAHGIHVNCQPPRSWCKQRSEDHDGNTRKGTVRVLAQCAVAAVGADATATPTHFKAAASCMSRKRCTEKAITGVLWNCKAGHTTWSATDCGPAQQRDKYAALVCCTWPNVLRTQACRRAGQSTPATHIILYARAVLAQLEDA